MARGARWRARSRRPRPRAFPDRATDRQGAPLRRVPAVFREHRVHQHDPGRQAGAHPRRPEPRASDPFDHPLERDGDGRAREQAHERRRAHRELRVGGHALRRRLQPFLARHVGQARRRSRLHPGPFVARRVFARVPARPPDRGATRQLPPGSRRPRHRFVSASMADAGFLAVPDGVDGTRSADGDLPGAVHEIPARSRPRRTPKAARYGASAATAKWTSRSRWARSAWRRAKTSTT